eukprot:15463408-Alexandrium_andersonii.AAC.1
MAVARQSGGSLPKLRVSDKCTEVKYPSINRLLGSWLYPTVRTIDMKTRIAMAWWQLHKHCRWWSNPALPRIVKCDLF